MNKWMDGWMDGWRDPLFLTGAVFRFFQIFSKPKKHNGFLRLKNNSRNLCVFSFCCAGCAKEGLRPSVSSVSYLKIRRNRCVFSFCGEGCPEGGLRPWVSSFFFKDPKKPHRQSKTSLGRGGGKEAEAETRQSVTK